MSVEFEMAKAVTQTYAEGMKQGGRMCLPALERAIAELDKHNPHVAIGIIEAEIRRIKGLPF